MPGGTTLDNTDCLFESEQRLEKLKEKKDIISQVYEEEAVITISLGKKNRDQNSRFFPRSRKRS